MHIYRQCTNYTKLQLRSMYVYVYNYVHVHVIDMYTVEENIHYYFYTLCKITYLHEKLMAQ